MAPVEEVNQKGAGAGAQTIDQDQKRVMLPGQPHQAIINQAEKGEPLFAVRRHQVGPERVLHHVDEGGPVIDDVKKARSPKDDDRERQQEEGRH